MGLARHEEEKIDLYVWRPLAQPFAVLFARAGLTPNHVSVIAMLAGAAGGWFFQYREASLVAWGVGLFLARHVLDYADGQVARLTGKGTPYGEWVDGLCDYVAYLSVYVFAAVGLWPALGIWAPLAALAAAWSAGVQAALVDFFKHEYAHWAHGAERDRFRRAEELRPEFEAARGFDRFLLWLAMRYRTRQATLAAGRLRRHAGFDVADPAFRERYARANRWMLKGWFLVGPNWHAYLFFAFGLLGRMDLCFATHVVVQNALVVALLALQRVTDGRVAARPSP